MVSEFLLGLFSDNIALMKELFGSVQKQLVKVSQNKSLTDNLIFVSFPIHKRSTEYCIGFGVAAISAYWLLWHQNFVRIG